MRILDISPITSTAQMPVKSGTLQFLQDIPNFQIQAILNQLFPLGLTTGEMYVLWGCGAYTVGGYTSPMVAGTWRIGQGAVVYYNSDIAQWEIFEVQDTTGTNTGSEVAILSIATGYQLAPNADPVAFTDGSSHDVHVIRTMQVAPGTAGTTYADLQYATVSYILLEELNTIGATSSTVNSITGVWQQITDSSYAGWQGGSGITPYVLLRYLFVGKTVYMRFQVGITNTTAPTSIALKIPVPAGATSVAIQNPNNATDMYDNVMIDNPTLESGYVHLINSASQLNFGLMSGNFTDGVPIIIYGSLTLEIQ